MASLQIPLALWKDNLDLNVSSFLVVSELNWLFLGLRTGRMLQVELAPCMESAQLSRFFIGHTTPIKSILLTTQPSDQSLDDTPTLVSLDENGGVALWNTEDGRCLLHNVMAIDGGAMGMCLSSGGNYAFLYGRTPFVNVIRLSTLEVVQSIPLRESIWVVDATVRPFNEERDELILVSTSGKETLKIHFDAQTAKALSASSLFFVSPSMVVVRRIAIHKGKYYISDGQSIWSWAFEADTSDPLLLWSDNKQSIADFLIFNDDLVLLLFDGSLIRLQNNQIVDKIKVPDETVLNKYSKLILWKDDPYAVSFPPTALRLFGLKQKDDVTLHWMKVKGFQGISCTTVFSQNGSESVVHGMSDGSIRIANLFDGMMTFGGSIEETITLSREHNCVITCLLVTELEIGSHHDRRTKVLLSGDMFGKVVLWDLKARVKVGVVNAHDSLICAIIPVPEHQKCIVVDITGRASIINIPDWCFFGFLGTEVVPIQKVKYHIAGDLKVCLFYVDGKTQLWNVSTKLCEREFNSSNFDESVHSFPGSWDIPWSGLPSSVFQNFDESHPVLGAAFSWRPNVPLIEPIQVALLDVRRLVANLRRLFTRDDGSLQGRSADQLQGALVFIMSLLLPWGIDEEIDSCAHRLGFSKRKRGLVLGVLGANGNISFPGPQHTGEEWKMSGTMSATLFLTLSAIFELPIDLGDEWDRLRMAYYSRILDNGLQKKLVSLPSFAFTSKYWHDLDEEIRHGSRLLIVQTLSKIDDASIRRIVTHWNHLLPANENESTGRKMNRAAVILGILAVHRPEFLCPESRKMVAESLMRQLMDEKRNLFRSAAIELVGRAYHVWEGNIHALSVFRLLHSWLSNMSQIDERNSIAQLIVPFDNASALDTVDAVRGTLLKLAAVAPSEIIPVWLGHSFATARTLTERWTTVSLLDDLIRQKPNVLRPYVTLIGEMIGKLLDSGSVVSSNAGGSKQRMLAIVTPLILDLIQIYPTVAYHRETHRMVTTTPADVRIHLHDLRGSSFIRLFEGHTQSITACALSPDGRMMVSYSMDEATLRWWLVPSGLIGFLSGSAKPFKTDVVDPRITEAARGLFDSLGDGGDGIVEIFIKWKEEHSISIFAKEDCITVVPVPSTS